MTQSASRSHIPGDWYPLGLPTNIAIGKNVYIDSSYGFAAVDSMEQPAITIGDASGVYDRAAFVLGPHGRVTVGAFTVLNGTYVLCNERIDIGSHCLLSWGVAITDNWFASALSVSERRSALAAASQDPKRHQPASGLSSPVVIEDNVWVGFDAVIFPGVRIGRGAIVGARTIVRRDVPPYAVVAGDRGKILRYIEPDDTVEAKEEALANLVFKP